MGFIEDHSSRNFNAGDVIFHEDDPGKSMFIIRSGIVEVLVKSASKQVVVATLKDGAIFGEMALIDGQPRSATVVAKSKTTCIEISQLMFQKRLSDLPGWMQSFYQILVERLRDSAKKIGSTITDDTGRQIVVLLHEILQKNDSPNSNVFQWKLTVESIAAVLIIPPAYVEKVLNKLTITKMARSEINYEGRKFIIDDIQGFKNFADYCRSKTLEKLGVEDLESGDGFTKREEELIDFVTKLVKEQASAPDLEEHFFKNRCKVDLGKEFEEIQPEFNRLCTMGIIKPRRDLDGHKFYDINLESVNKIEAEADKLDKYETLESKLK